MGFVPIPVLTQFLTVFDCFDYSQLFFLSVLLIAAFEYCCL